MQIRSIVLLLLLTFTGCPCDSTCDCRKAETPTSPHVSAIASDTGSSASQAAIYVINDQYASQERKAQALQLLFEIERGRQLTDSVRRVDTLAAQLEVILEREVEREDGR